MLQNTANRRIADGAAKRDIIRRVDTKGGKPTFAALCMDDR